MKIRLSSGERAFQYLNYGFMLALCGLTLYPFWYVLVLSLNAAGDTMLGGVYWWPRRFTLNNYTVLIQDGAIVRTFLMSCLRVGVHVPSHLFITGMAAYALSRREFRIRGIFIALFFFTFLFSGGLIPKFLLLNDLRLLNTFWVYVLPYLFAAWNFIIMKTFIQTTIPESLIEAAVIDGAHHFFIFRKIVAPLSVAVFATLGLFQAVYHWNDWFVGAYFIFDDRLLPLQTYLQRLIRGAERQLERLTEREHTDMALISPRSLTMAAIIVSVGPIIFVYPFIQRYFIKGIRIGAIKQ